MKGTLITIIIIIVIIIGGVFIFSDREVATENTQEKSVANSDISINTVAEKKQQFDSAPQFSLPDFNGNIISLSDSSGKVRVVNSWATWCPFCVDELPDFVRLQEEFGDKVEVIAIDRAESLNKAKSFIEELGITSEIKLLLDEDDSFYQSIGGFSMPETLFIDGEGNIRVHKRGPMELDEMIEKVQTIINNS